MASPAELQAILDGPSLAAPAGETYQFENPPNINTTCFSVLGVFLTLALGALFIQIYTKWLILRAHAIEDYFLILGTSFFVVYTVLSVKLVREGAGTHQWNIQVKNISGLLYWTNADEIIYSFAIVFTKISIVLQYLSIFKQIKKLSFMYLGCLAVMVLTVSLYTAAIFIQIFACSPRRKIWNQLISGHCVDTTVLVTATGAFNVASDLFLVLLPQHEIWRLQMSAKKKLAVSAVFLTGLIACVTSVLRLYFSVKLEQTGDASYNIALVGVWSVAENSIGIFCCCMPVFPRFFKALGPKIASVAKSSFSIGTLSKKSTISKDTTTTRKHSTGRSRSGSAFNSHPPQGKFHGTYETLDDSHEMFGMVDKETGGKGMKVEVRDSHAIFDQGNKEEGSGAGIEVMGIRKTQSFSINRSPAAKDDMDVEAQRRIQATRMGW